MIKRIGFLDESGDADPFTGSRVLVVAVLVTHAPRRIELKVKRARQKLRRKARQDELKASKTDDRIIARFLEHLVSEDVEIIAVIVDKRAILRPPNTSEDIYRESVAKVVAHCVKRWPHIELFLDKRYTNVHLTQQLEAAIHSEIADLSPDSVLIHQKDSRKIKGLQAVDFVAWAIYRKYEANDERFYTLIEHRIVIEEVIQRTLWQVQNKKAALPGPRFQSVPLHFSRG